MTPQPMGHTGKSAGRAPVAGALVAMLILAGCASTHGLKPQAELTGADTLAAGRALTGTSVDPAAWPAQDWWTRFGDPQLDQLMREALAGSPSLKVALARARQASALADQANAARSPRVDSSLSATRERFSANGVIPPPFAGGWTTFDQLQATLSWDIDFWGKNRAAFEQALGLARSAAVDAQAAQLALSVDMAHAYVQLLRAYLQLDVAQATVAQRERILALTRERNAAGIDSRLELKQAEAAVPAAREQVEQLNETIALTRNQMAALLGQGPDRGLAIERPAAMASADAALPSQVPSQLLGRRPDIVAQRWRVEAARRGIHVAQTQFYPDVNLTAFVGFQSLGTSSFLSLGSRQLGVGPALSLPLFDAGQRRANLAAADAQYDAAVEQYNQTLSDALREVVDQLSSFRSLARQRVEQQEALAASRDAYDLATLRYREGVGNYLQVLSAEAPLLTQEALEVDLRARALDLSIKLVRALGGGLQEPSAAVASATP
ncbi:MAG TPA: efflux transporter outer membrane subunit [Burkholderiaceae bacterium]|nr:efflux transporter outer membrane subunit [Burkholderiaceae bacterium]